MCRAPGGLSQFAGQVAPEQAPASFFDILVVNCNCPVQRVTQEPPILPAPLGCSVLSLPRGSQQGSALAGGCGGRRWVLI